MQIWSVYIMASKRNGTLYVGVTRNLKRRVYEHRTGEIEGFTKQYNIKQLVYYETFYNPRAAIDREKQLKWWKRAWKIRLIETINPNWDDLYDQLFTDSYDNPAGV